MSSVVSFLGEREGDVVMFKNRGVTVKRMRVADDDEDSDDTTSVTRRGTAIYFAADVSKKSVRELSELLDEAQQCCWETWNRVDKPRITLFIHSSGGCVHAGMRAHELIRRCPLPVVTIGEGLVASSATLLHLAGNLRLIAPSTHVLIHQLRSSADGTHSELRDEILNNKMLMKRLREIYLQTTKLPEKKLDKLLKRELELNTDAALKYGVADGVITSDGIKLVGEE